MLRNLAATLTLKILIQQTLHALTLYIPGSVLLEL